MIWQIAVLATGLAAVLLVVGYSLSIGISPMPSSRKARAVILDLTPERAGGVIYELGSGWGSLALPLARAHPEASVVAIELSPLPWLFSVFRQALVRLPNLVLRRGDFFHMQLSDAGVIVCYLYTGAMARLATKLEAELEPGTVVLSIGFALPGRMPDLSRTLDNPLEGKVYRYVFS